MTEVLILEANTLKYRRQDVEGGYIYDKQDIDYFRTTQRNDVIDNSLLGDFNMVGSYVINNNLITELIKMKKIFTDSYSKAIFCESLKKFDGESYKFRLNIISNSPSKGKVTASLELLEEISRTNGYYKNTNSVMIDSKVFPDTKDVDSKIFKTYNILNKDSITGDAKIENDFEFPNIIRRRSTLKQLKEMGLNINARVEKELFEKRIEVLKSSPKCAPLLEEFNRQIFHVKDRFLDKNSKQYYRHLNQVLDGVFDMYGYLLADEKDLLSAYKKVNSVYAERLMKTDMILTSELTHNLEMKDKKAYEELAKSTPKVKVIEPKKAEEVKDSKPEQKQEKKAEQVEVKKPVVKPTPKQVKAKKSKLSLGEIKTEANGLEKKSKLTQNKFEAFVEEEENF